MIPFAACRPYLPQLVSEWPEKSPDARWRAIEGSMVFADVSGFTSMSERLARQGRVGAEEVTAVISATFDRLLAEAYSYGGSLLKFGGDAQLVFFTDADHPARAASAAIGMREELRRFGSFTTSAGKVTLRVSVGAHSGTFHFFLVGEWGWLSVRVECQRAGPRHLQREAGGHHDSRRRLCVPRCRPSRDQGL